MKFFKSFIMAFSLYSRIPMSHINYETGDDSYAIAFFPFVGLVIGTLFYGWNYLIINIFNSISIRTDILRICIGVAIPLIITGGFHLDGFMDVCDAINSFNDKEKKLSIMKDPHIGAFSVIRLIVLGLFYIGAYSIILDMNILLIASFIPIISRIISAYSVLTLNNAKKEGMLYYESYSSGGTKDGNRKRRNINLLILLVESLVIIAFLCCFDWLRSLMLLLSMGIFFLYYRNKCYREFGGITGDTSGYLVCVNETVGMIMLALISLGGMII